MQKRNTESKIVVYSKPGLCVQCVAVKRWLTENGLDYEERNALEYMDILTPTGIKSMPIVDGGNGNFFGGFDVGKLKRLAQ